MSMRSYFHPFAFSNIAMATALSWCAMCLAAGEPAPRGLFLKSRDVPALRQRLGAPAYQLVLQQAETALRERKRPSMSTITQYHAMAYLATGDVSRAQAAVDELMLWAQAQEKSVPTVTGKTEQSLSISRQAFNACLIYATLEPLGAIESDQRAYLEKVLAMCASRLMERGTSFERDDYFDPHFRVSNWNTDRLTMVGMFALAFPEHPNSTLWLQHAIREIEWQLDHVVMPDGAWPEGTRYHGAVLRTIIPFAFALREAGHVDLFGREPLRRMLDYLVRIQSPPDRTLGNLTLTPGVFDANWENVWSYLLAWGAKAYAPSDPAFAGRLMWGWQRAGAPLLGENSPGTPLGALLFTDVAIRPIEQPPLESEVLPSGYAVLRDGFGTERESLLLVSVATSRGIWHEHSDRGGLSLFAFRTPLALDPGITRYDATRGEWYIRSRAHNLVMFDGKDVGGNGAVATWFSGDAISYVDADLSGAVGGSYHRRIFRITSDFYLVWDVIGRPGNAEYHLHVLGQEQSADRAEQIQFQCDADVGLEVGLLWPPDVDHRIDTDPHPAVFETMDMNTGLPHVAREIRPRWLRVGPVSDATDIVTVLRPYQGKAPPAVMRRIGSSQNDPAVLEVEANGVTTRFHLASDKQKLSGAAGVERRSVTDGQLQSLCLIDGTLFGVDDGWRIATNASTSILLRPVSDGAWEVQNLGAPFVKLDLTGPWGKELKQLNVTRPDGVEEPTLERDPEQGTIRWSMSAATYRISIDKPTREAAQREAAEHPCLLLGASDVAAFRERLAREPHRTAYQRLKAFLDQGMPRRAGDDERDTSMMRSQIGALIYTVTGDRHQAEDAAKEYMSRIESWRHSVPEYRMEERSQSYRTMYRQLHNLCIDYDLLQPAGVFSKDEQTLIRQTLGNAVSRFMERGETFNPEDYYNSAGMRASNTNSDRLAAVGMFCLAFPEHPLADAWLEHVVREIQWQLNNTTLADGAWPEGTRYQGAILRQYVPFAVALRRNDGADLLSHPKFKLMFESLIQLQAPKDRMLDGIAVIAGIGDANWENIWEAVLGWGTGAYAQSDPAFASRLKWAWERAGAPFTVELSPGNPAVGLFLVDPNVKSVEQPPLMNHISAMGHVLRRTRFGTEEESWLLLNGTSVPDEWHHHPDKGSFSWYASGVPIALDPGVADYAKSRGRWYAKRAAHNAVVFGGKDQRAPARVSRNFFAEPCSYTDLDLGSESSQGYHRRVLSFGPDCQLVWDAIPGESGAEFHLHVLAEKPETIDGNAVSFPCMRGMVLDFRMPARADSPAIADAKVLRILQDEYPIRFFAEREGLPTVVRELTPRWLRLEQRVRGQDFVTLLRASKADAPTPLEFRAVEMRGDEVAVAEIANAGSSTRVFFGVDSAKSEALEGVLGVVQDATQMSQRQSILMVDATIFAPSPEITLSANVPSCIEVRQFGPGEWQVTNHGDGFEQVKLKLPWAGPIEQAKVLRSDGSVEPTARCDRAHRTVEFIMNDRVVRILCEARASSTDLDKSSSRCELSLTGKSPGAKEMFLNEDHAN